MWITGHSPCEFMHDLYIAEIYRSETILLLQTILAFTIHSLLHNKLWTKSYIA